MASRRRNSRIAVMQTLFEVDFNAPEKEQSPEEILVRNIEEAGKENVDVSFAQELLRNTVKHMDTIQTAVQEHAPQWPLERMDRITRAILMIGTEEILYTKDAPPAVVMNEAIEMAKEFGGAESGKFVNGVLNALAHD